MDIFVEHLGSFWTRMGIFWRTFGQLYRNYWAVFGGPQGQICAVLGQLLRNR